MNTKQIIDQQFNDHVNAVHKAVQRCGSELGWQAAVVEAVALRIAQEREQRNKTLDAIAAGMRRRAERLAKTPE